MLSRILPEIACGAGRARRRSGVQGLAAGVALTLALTATAASAAGKREDCFSPDSDPDATIAGCTLVINQRKRESNGDVAIAFYNRGLSYAKKDDPKRAVAEFSEAIKIDPSDADYFRNRGENYGELEQYDLALKDLDQAIRLDGQNANNFRVRGWTHRTMGAYAEAVRDYDAAVRLDPKDSWSLRGRGLTYEKMDDIPRALADLEAAARLDTDSDGLKGDLKRVRAVAATGPAASPAGAATLADLDAQERAVDAIWMRLPFTVRRSVFTTEKAPSYGTYRERPDSVFAPGEAVVSYLEPVGFSWKPNADGTFGIGVVVDYELVTKSGEVLGGQKGVLEQNFSSHNRVREFFITFTGTFTGLPAGDYRLVYTLHDKGSDKTARVEQAFTVKG